MVEFTVHTYICYMYIEGGCPMETDAEFQMMWPTSLPNTNVNNTCRGGTGAYTCM